MPDQPAPLTGGKLALIAFALALGTFMMVLDSTIANVSLPTIAGNLGVSSDNSTWVITAFAVANGVAVPLNMLNMTRGQPQFSAERCDQKSGEQKRKAVRIHRWHMRE
jgi:DHA2 family multidrug resistance protein